MSDEELVNTIISQYTDLMRIKNAENRDAEIETQERRLRVILQSMGIPVEELRVAR